MDFAIEIVLCWVIWWKKWRKHESIHVKKYLRQRRYFSTYCRDKTIYDKKELQRLPKCKCRSWSRYRNSDLRRKKYLQLRNTVNDFHEFLLTWFLMSSSSFLSIIRLRWSNSFSWCTSIWWRCRKNRSWSNKVPFPFMSQSIFVPLYFSYANEPVLWIRDILVPVQIGSASLTNGFGSCSGSCYFRPWPSRRQQKLFVF